MSDERTSAGTPGRASAGRDYATPLARQILGELTGELIAAGVWDKLDERQRNLVARVSRRAAEMQLAKLAGFHWDEREWLHCKAQVASLTAVGSIRAEKAFIRAVRRGVELLRELIR